MKPKIDIVKIATFGAAALSIVGTVIGSWAQNKTMNDTIAKEVEKAVSNLK